MHWRRKWQPSPVFLPGESQGQRSLVGCRLWGSIPGSGGSRGEGNGNLWHPVFLPGKSHGQRRLAGSGDTARLMQSPVCPTNTVFCCPVSMSHRALQGGGTRCHPARPAQRCLPSHCTHGRTHGCLTTWCPRSWSRCCCRPGNGSRRDNLVRGVEAVTTGPWLPGTTCRYPRPLTHLCEPTAPG